MNIFYAHNETLHYPLLVNNLWPFFYFGIWVSTESGPRIDWIQKLHTQIIHSCKNNCLTTSGACCVLSLQLSISSWWTGGQTIIGDWVLLDRCCHCACTNLIIIISIDWLSFTVIQLMKIATWFVNKAT